MSGPRTTAIEKLETRLAELKERQKKLIERKRLIEASKDAAEKRRARKEENRRKYEFGGLVKLAGLFDWDKGKFIGALLVIKDRAADEENVRRFKERGDALLARREQQPNVSKQAEQLHASVTEDPHSGNSL